MAKWEKRLERMRENPRGWRYEEVARILERHGFERPSKSGGSHRVFKHPSGLRVSLVDRGKGDMKPVYVEEAVEAVDRIREAIRRKRRQKDQD